MAEQGSAAASGVGREWRQARGDEVTVSERWKTERLLAVARAVLAVVSVLIVTGQLDQSPGEHRRLVVAAVEAYGAISLGVLVVLLGVRRVPSATVTIVHVLDEAAFRWGLTATLWTAAVAMGLLVFEARTWREVHSLPALSEATSLLRNQLAMRATFLLLMGFLLGYLAEIEKRFRRRARLVADVLAGVQRRPGLRGAVRAVLGGFLDFYRAGQGVLVAAAEGRQALAWEAHRMPGGQVAVSLRKPAPWLEWLGAIPPARVWHARRKRRTLHGLALNEERRLQRFKCL